MNNEVLLSQGTDMRLAKICKGGCGNKPAMWIDGGNDIFNNVGISIEWVTELFRNTCKRMGDFSCCYVCVKRACWEWFSPSGLTRKYWLVSSRNFNYIVVQITTFLSLCEGIFFLWWTLTVICILRQTTDCGERRGVRMVTTASERMPTEILAFTGGQEVILNLQ